MSLGRRGGEGEEVDAMFCSLDAEKCRHVDLPVRVRDGRVEKQMRREWVKTLAERMRKTFLSVYQVDNRNM